MADLGDFGAAVRELDEDRELDTFTFCGEAFTVAGQVPPLLVVQLGAAFTGKIGETEMLAATWESLRCSLTIPAHGDQPADGAGFARFYRLAVDNVAPFEDIARLTMTLAGVETGRPTKPASVSSGGPPPTSRSLSSPSTPPEWQHLTPVADLVG